MKTHVFLTTQTSATASIWRILTTLVGEKLECNHFVADYYDSCNMDALRTAEIPWSNQLIQFNAPTFFNKDLDLSLYRFVVNYRDPRDRLCNVFHWKLIHPAPNETQETLEERAQRILAQGIDSWVLQNIDVNYYKNIFFVLEKCKPESCIVLTYARLCLDFDSFIKQAADFFEVELSEKLLSALALERTENLTSNSQWIGNQWKGSDVMPGRYLRELKPETIACLNERFEPILKMMAQYDPDYAELYLHGL